MGPDISNAASEAQQLEHAPAPSQEVVLQRSFKVGGQPPTALDDQPAVTQKLQELAELDGRPDSPDHEAYRKSITLSGIRQERPEAYAVADALAKEMAGVMKDFLEFVEQLPTDDSSLAFSVRLVTEEMLVNHVMHGNRWDPRKSVDIEVTAVLGDNKLKQLVVSSRDEGKGFDRTAVADCTMEECLEKQHGRGTLFCNAYSASVRSVENGRGLIIGFVPHAREQTADESAG